MVLRGTMVLLAVMVVPVAVADVILDSFDNDNAPTNGPGIDCNWNPPPAGAFQVSTEQVKVFSGGAALKVTWENKDLWPNFVIANLDQDGNVGNQFIDYGNAVQMAIAGPAGRVIMKFVDADGKITADLGSVETSGSDDFQTYDFEYFTFLASSDIDLERISEIQLLIDAGVAGTSGTIYIDDIRIIEGAGDEAIEVAMIDNFDNDNSIADDPAAPDSTPSSASLLGGPFQTSIVADPAASFPSALKIEYKTGPWSVLWVEDLDVTDWTPFYELTVDVYGTAGNILLKLKNTEGKEQEPGGGFQHHVGDQWDTMSWDLTVVTEDILANMGKLIVFVEGPSGGEGTIYFDNLALRDGTRVSDWPLH